MNKTNKTKTVSKKKKAVTKKKASTKTAKTKVLENTKPKYSANHKWFVLSTYAGHENKVLENLKQRISANKAEDMISDIVVPTQNKIVIKEGKKKTVEERFFPGYMLIHMDLNEVTWHIVRNAEGVKGFVGTDRKPTPLSDQEAQGILKYMEVEQPAFQSAFLVGDAVKVVDGPFKEFVGSVREINETKGKVKVLLSVFGRETPVDLDFLQIKKL